MKKAAAEVSWCDSEHGDIYIDMDELEPGDIVLSRSIGKEGKLIAATSGGPFSHAAIAVSSSMLFESDDLGVSYSPLPYDRLERQPEGGFRYLARMKGTVRAMALRHPKFDTLGNAETRSELLYKICKNFAGYEYPELAKLAQTVVDYPALKSLVAVLLGAIDRVTGEQKIAPGFFCSQLVAAIFDAVGLSCFDPARPPEEISPNSFLESVLICEPRVITYADAKMEEDVELANDLRMMQAALGNTREQFAEVAVGLTKRWKRAEEWAARTRKQLSEVNELMEQLRVIMKRRGEEPPNSR